MKQTIKYKGFEIKKSITSDIYYVFGKSFFEPVMIQYTYGTLKDCKGYINHFLNTYNLKTL